MSDFTERAAAEAEKLWPHTPHPETAMEHGFLAGAEWARDVLLADPSDAEVETVAEALVAERYRMHGVDLEKAKSSGAMWRLDIEFLRPQARAAIAAFLSARRGSE